MAESASTLGQPYLNYQDRSQPSLIEPGITPSYWFASQYPQAAKTFGSPFLEVPLIITHLDGTTYTQVIPSHINEDFFAAILSGKPDLNHRTIYYLPENTFYYKDHDAIYYPVPEERLALLLSNQLMRCATAMDGRIRIERLVGEFRDKEQLRAIVKKAKTILSVDKDFFSPASPNRRLDGPERLGQSINCFVANRIVEKQGYLLIKDALARFNQEERLNPDRRKIKPVLVQAVYQRFGQGLRHDLQDNQGNKCHGWTNLSLLEVQTRNN